MASPSTGPVESVQQETEAESTISPLIRQRDAGQIARDQELFDDHKKQSWTDRQASSDEFDRSLLTLSSGTLALSLAFIKDVVPLAQAAHLSLLFVSWGCFVSCILITLASFRLSMLAHDRHLEFARLYYIEGDAKAHTQRHWSTGALDWCAYVGGVLFLAGFVLTVLFAIINIEAIKMDNDKKKAEVRGVMAHDGRPPVSVVTSSAQEERGRQPVPVVQGNTLDKGRTPVPIVTVPAKTGTQTGGSSTGSNSGQQTSGGKQ